MLTSAYSQKRHKSLSPPVSFPESHNTVIPHVTHEKKDVLANYPLNYDIPLFFLFHQKRKQPY